MTAAPADGVLLRSAGPVTLVGAGPVAAADLAAALALAPEAVAADGGAAHALSGGARFRAVIGDLDSLAGRGVDAAALRAAGVPVHRVAEQDTTDLEKCLRAVAAPLVIGVGFLGGRLDHELAALSALLRFAPQPVVLVGRGELCLALTGEFALPLPAGTRVSVFPLRPVTGTVSRGLRWSVEGLTLAAGARVGTSNEALGGEVRLGFDRPGALLILPDRMLPEVVARLLS